jgi:antitoxin MazE
MKTRIQKWGNSLALRIPKSFASEVGLKQDAPVEVSLLDGKLVVTPIIKSPFTLNDLLSQVTDDNLHREVDIGPAIGHESW